MIWWIHRADGTWEQVPPESVIDTDGGSHFEPGVVIHQGDSLMSDGHRRGMEIRERYEIA